MSDAECALGVVDLMNESMTFLHNNLLEDSPALNLPPLIASCLSPETSTTLVGGPHCHFYNRGGLQDVSSALCRLFLFPIQCRGPSPGWPRDRRIVILVRKSSDVARSQSMSLFKREACNKGAQNNSV